jgi:hypothetical protein
MTEFVNLGEDLRLKHGVTQQSEDLPKITLSQVSAASLSEIPDHKLAQTLGFEDQSAHMSHAAGSAPRECSDSSLLCGQ